MRKSQNDDKFLDALKTSVLLAKRAEKKKGKKESKKQVHK